jgi:hypothetical protein
MILCTCSVILLVSICPAVISATWRSTGWNAPRLTAVRNLDGVLQGHAVWHVLTASAAGLLYL